MKIVAICGAGIGSSGILKVNAERVLKKLDIEADVTAVHLDSLDQARDAQVILTSAEFVEAIGKTFADLIVIDNVFDTNELTQKLEASLGS
jgi:PTS system ascorbate-specific IIB component